MILPLVILSKIVSIGLIFVTPITNLPMLTLPVRIVPTTTTKIMLRFPPIFPKGTWYSLKIYGWHSLVIIYLIHKKGRISLLTENCISRLIINLSMCTLTITHIYNNWFIRVLIGVLLGKYVTLINIYTHLHLNI